ncbi:MAG: copper chaperone PCu(A)C [Actinomycetota bacterium]
MTRSARQRIRRTAKGFALVAASALVIASCGGDDDSSADTAAPVGADIAISAAWARTSPMSVTVGAVYMDITASADDELLSASVDPSIAASVEIHETVAADMTSGDSAMPGEEGEEASEDTMAGDMSGGMTEDTMAGDMSGEMTMRPVSSVVLPAGETVMLMPGGYHIMLLDLAAPLEVGQTFDVTLTFANAGTKVVTVEVRDEAP